MKPLSYEDALQDVVHYISTQKKWVSSTCSQGKVTSRMMRVINEGLTMYFQTNTCYEKHH